MGPVLSWPMGCLFTSKGIDYKCSLWQMGVLSWTCAACFCTSSEMLSAPSSSSSVLLSSSSLTATGSSKSTPPWGNSLHTVHICTSVDCTYNVSQKRFPPLNSLYLCQILTDFQNFCTARRRMKFAKNPIRHHPPLLRHVATLEN